MIAADEIYDTALLEQPWDEEPEPCRFIVEATIEDGQFTPDYCGVDALPGDDRCAEHAGMQRP